MIARGKLRSRKRCDCRLLIATAFLFMSGTAGAQNSAPASNGAHNITGFWFLRFDSRNVPKAALLPSVTPKMIAAHEAEDAHAIRWCQYEGMPYVMESSTPLDVLEGKTQIVIASETPSGARHIYIDRTARPDPSTFDPTRIGFSIGHWDGDALIVETKGFNDDGHTAIPGGGFRTHTSVLMERYQLVDDGKELEVTFTWTDPKVFAAPHTYAFRYYRAPREYNAGEFFCDSNDQERANFLTKPPLQVK